MSEPVSAESGSLLPPFPLDGVTLANIEHSLNAHLTFEGEGGEHLDEPRLVGADFQLATLLDFLSGALGDDPNGYQIDRDDVRMPGIGGREVWVDTRPHYTEHDLIRALITEVRRLRERPTPPGTGDMS